MLAATCPAAAPEPSSYAAADATFAQTRAFARSREAWQMSESDLERELDRRGRELMRQLLQGHLDQRSRGEAAGPVVGADGVERSERRVHERRIETTFGTVRVARTGYARTGQDSLHPLASGGAVGGSGGCGLRRLLRGASGGRGPAGCRRLDRRADLRQQGCRAAPPGPARGDAQGGREAPAATRACRRSSA